MEQIGTNGGKRRRVNGQEHKAAGKKDSHGQEQTINATALKEGWGKAVKMRQKTIEQQQDEGDFFKKFSELTGLSASRLKAGANAVAKDNVEAERRKAEQTTLIFDETGA